VALAYAGNARFAKLVKEGVRAANEVGSNERAKLLGRIARVGPAALSEGSVLRSILAEAGQVAGGLLTPRDLSATPVIDFSGPPGIESDGLLRAPWLEGAALGRARSARKSAGTETILAVDAHGVLAALSYQTKRGLPVETWQVELSLDAEPVLRGARRRTPGSPIQSAMPFGIQLSDGLPCEVFADGGSAIVRDTDSGAAHEKRKATRS
jgi:hypothetical protein